MGKPIEHLWRTVTTQSGWMELEESQHLDSCQAPARVVVTIREGEERGLCSAALKELLRTVKDQVEERSVVVIVIE